MSMPQLVLPMVDNLVLDVRWEFLLRNCTRGPMSLKELTSYKYVVTGDGQIRGVRDEDWIYRFGEYGC